MRFYRSKLYASVIPILALALFVGFAGALLGIGGGFIVVPALLYLFRVPPTWSSARRSSRSCAPRSSR